MTIPLAPPDLDPTELALVSRCVYHYRPSDLTVDMLNGQKGTFTRNATATFLDSLGVTCTAGYGQPRFEPRSFLGSTRMGLLLGTSDRLTFAADLRPRALAFWFAFEQIGAIGAAGTGLFSLCNDAATGARLVLDSSGAFYRLTHHNGSSSITVTLAAAPVNGDDVVLWGYLYGDGSVQLFQQIGSANATNTARSSANALGSAWATGARLRFNGVGTGGTGSLWLDRFRMMLALPTYAELSRTQ